MANIREEIIEQIGKLPKGNITYKTIRGSRRMYLQWTENGKKQSRYVRAGDERKVLDLVSRRKALEQELKLIETDVHRADGAVAIERKPADKYETRVVLGDELISMCEATRDYDKRDCFRELWSFLNKDIDGKVCIIYGLRRTGKTFMIRQAILDLPRDNAAYVKIRTSDNMAMLNRDLMQLSSSGIRYVFIDEITLMSDFIDSASLISDIYAASGMKIVLSGTDSLGFALASDDELYDRTVKIHTTFIPFREHARLLGVDDVDEYIRYGGTFRVGELDFEDEDLLDEGASFRDDESTRRYIDTSIARNIQHSLAGYRAGGHFRHLSDLYERGELTNAINRLVEDMNHRFLLSVLTKDFVSHDLGSYRQIDRKKSAQRGEEGILDRIDEAGIIDTLMKILDIRNSADMSVLLAEDHINEIKQYLFMLDLIVDAPTETIDSNVPIERIVFSQPGMRYSQAQALVYSLMRDDEFIKYPALQRKAVTDGILEEVRGRMLEEIVLLETIKSLPRGKRAFKLEFASGEFDMVIYDENELQCEIYEIKHSDRVASAQYRYLVDEEKCNATEFRYGSIVLRCVLYNGTDTEVDGIQYKNIASYLMGLMAGKDRTSWGIKPPKKLSPGKR